MENENLKTDDNSQADEQKRDILLRQVYILQTSLKKAMDHVESAWIVADKIKQLYGNNLILRDMRSSITYAESTIDLVLKDVEQLAEMIKGINSDREKLEK